MTIDRTGILQEGRSCWRIGRAARAAVLVDGAAYFGALRRALLKAERSIFIVGWDIDSRVELTSGDSESERDGAPTRLSELLAHLVRRRPQLRVHLLLWDYSVVYALEREPLPTLKLSWSTPRQIKVCLDDVLPLGACHHQKIVVVDDAIAFSGGLDLTIRRWDTCEHRPDHPLRCDPRGEAYGPFHDIQMCVDGEAALLLADLVRRRWLDAACAGAPPVQPTGDPWPDGLAPDLSEVDVAVARTLPAINGVAGVREVEALFLAAIDRGERLIYIENQFLTADVVAERLARRLREKPSLEALLVAPKTHTSWLEAHSMWAGRLRFMHRLEDAGVADRVRLVYPAVAAEDGEQAVMVHAKLMIVDDRFVRVGSANLNNRSMGMDTECDLAVEAANADQRRAIARVRDRLLGEHLGVPAARVAEALDSHASPLAALDALAREERGLRPIRDGDHRLDPITHAVADLADPERPIEASEFIGDMFGGEPAARPLGRIAAVALAALALIGFALAWRYTPLAELVDGERLRALLSALAASRWAPLLVPAIYVLGGLIAFPLTVLIALTAMVFDPLPALVYAGTGSLISAVVTYGLGALAGRGSLRDLAGQRLNRVSRALARKGVLSVMAVRLVPIAPFTVVNLIAGVSHVRFSDYFLGTVLGMAPGIVIIAALGHRLARVLADPSLAEIGLLALVAGLWLGISVALQILVSRMRSRRSA